MIIAAVMLLGALAACGTQQPAVTTAAAAETTAAATTAAAAETTTAAAAAETTTAAATTTAAVTTVTAATTTAAATTAAPTEAETGLDPKYAEPIVVSMNVMNAERNGQDIRSQTIQEKFNLTFDYIPVNWSDWNEKIRTWIATDDAPDLIWWDLKGAQAQEFKSWASQGAFSPFKAEYFTADRPNLSHVYQNSPSVEALSVDGDLYAWPSLRDNPPEAQNCYTSVWDYSRDWARAVGKYNEDDIYTWDEWIDLLRAVYTEDPGQNGPANAVLVMPTWAFPHAPVLFISAPAAEGNETCSYIRGADGQYVWPPSLPEYRMGVKMTYDMYQEGLIYKDNIVFTGNEQDDMIRAGLAFANYNVTGGLNGHTDIMLQDGVLENREDFGIAIVVSHDGNWYMSQTEDYWTVTCMNGKLTDAKIDRILDFWEFLFTVEGIRLRLWGGEGEHFEVTGPAVTDVNMLWEYSEEGKYFISPFQNRFEFNEANGAVNGAGLTYLTPGNPTYTKDETLRLFNTMASGRIPVIIKPFDYEVSFSVYPNKGRYGSFGSEVKEEMIALIAQPNIDVEAEWDRFIESMMPRVQSVLDELNAN